MNTSKLICIATIFVASLCLAFLSCDGGKSNRELSPITLDNLTDANGSWEKIYGDEKIENVKFVFEMYDGNFLIIGYSYVRENSLNSSYTIFLLKIDPQGNLISKQLLLESSYTAVWDAHKTSNNEFLLVGTASNDVLLLKLDKDANVVYEKYYGGSSGDSGWKMLETNFGYLIAGKSSSKEITGREYNGGIGHDFMYLVRLDKEGNLLSHSYYGSEDIADIVGMAQTYYGEFVIVGNIYMSNLDEDAGGQDIYAMVLDENGDLVDIDIIGGNGWDEANAIYKTKDGEILVVGRSSSDDIKGVYLDHLGNSSTSAYMIRLGKDGYFFSHQLYGTYRAREFFSVQQTQQGEIILLGDGYSDKFVDENMAQADIIAVSFNENLEFKDVNIAGDSNIEEGKFILEVDDGLVVIGESYDSHINPQGVHKVYIERLDKDWNSVGRQLFGGNEDTIITQAIKHSDGGILLVGETTATDIEGADPNSKDVYVLKLDIN